MHDRPLPPLLLWVAGSATAVAVLTAAGAGALAGPPPLEPSGWAAWSAGRDGLLAGVALVRTGLVAVASYLLVVSLLLSGRRTAELAVAVAPRRLTGAMRRGAAGVGLVSAALAAVPTRGAASETTAGEEVAVMRRLPPDGGPGASAEPAPPPAPGLDTPADREVRPGEHFWSIAARTLEDAHDRPPSISEVERYWRRLVDANRDRLVVPGEPDLLYPGQVLRLPLL